MMLGLADALLFFSEEDGKSIKQSHLLGSGQTPSLVGIPSPGSCR